MKTKKITPMLLAATISTFVFGQEIGKKATLNEDGTFSAETITLPQELIEKQGGFSQLDNFPFGRPTHPNFKNFRGATIAYINNDDQQDILFATYDKLYAIDGNGDLIWEKTLQGTATLPPTVADLDDDGNLEIIQNTGGVPANGRVYLLDAATGDDITGWPLNFDNHWMVNAPAVADVNDDGIMEISFCERVSTTEGYIHLVTPDGDPYNANWPVELPGTPAFTPSIGDVNNDGTIDIVISTSSGNLYVLDTETGENISGFPMTETGISFSYQSPILVDLNDDDTLEIVGSNHGDNPSFFVVQSDGTYAPGWPHAIGEWTYSPPTVADINDDGEYELFFGNRNTSGDGSTPLDVVYGFDYAGDDIPNFPINKYGGTEGVMTIADIDNDGVMDIIFPSIVLGGENGYIHAYATDGSGELAGFPLRPRGFTFINGAVLGDVDGDGLLDLTANSYTQTFGASIDSAFVNVYNMNVPYDPSKILMNGYKGSNVRDGLVTENTGMSVADFSLFELEIVPNPSSGTLNFTIPESMSTSTLQLFTLDGKLVHVEKGILPRNGGNALELSHLKSGLYLVTISDNKSTYTGKWIKK